ncbi:gliding motility-associated ABC transporter ATP-binding subunit GldA [Polaribacter sp. Hel_I_88]|uniref:gliding motility-associated ABC transporter ATP-binding subunit GldA n=1 Tax=Polaribacter sp. Hel_I_88 TaxID=1250006 RepID=UPI00047BCE07|nr:gliding motility-associated ABC transporter ATP-binding subunit GldA [Polaribacter sp. Hel_I_88]
MSIKVSKISKVYGSQKALNNVSFAAEKGQIIGFLGPNGAGKSTMMKILTGFIKPDSGEVFVDEIDVLKNPLEAQKTIGYLPEQNPLYKEMYVREYLQFQANIFNISSALDMTAKKQIEICIEKVGLTIEAHKKIHQLSKGYQQRVGLAAAILHNPSVLILDEPTTGLDPNQLVEIRQLIKDLGKEKTVLFSTHIMQEVDAVCDRVIIIKKGEILVDKKLSTLKENKQQVIEVTFNMLIDEKLFHQLKNLVAFNNLSENTWQLFFNSNEDMRSKIFDFAQENNLKILGLTAQNKNLETLFREVTA